VAPQPAMLSQSKQSTRFGIYGCTLVALALAGYHAQAEHWFLGAMVATPSVFALNALLFAKSKRDVLVMLCLAVISVRIIESLQYHYVMAASKMEHADETDHLCRTNPKYAWTEADKADRGEKNGCSEATKIRAMSRFQIALASVGGLNGWVWLLTGLDFKAGFHTLAESHVGYLWAAGTCFSVVTLVSVVAMAIYWRIMPSSAPVRCAPEHTNALYTPPPPQLTYKKPDVFELPTYAKTDIFKSKRE